MNCQEQQFLKELILTQTRVQEEGNHMALNELNDQRRKLDRDHEEQIHEHEKAMEERINRIQERIQEYLKLIDQEKDLFKSWKALENQKYLISLKEIDQKIADFMKSMKEDSVKQKAYDFNLRNDIYQHSNKLNDIIKSIICDNKQELIKNEQENSDTNPGSDVGNSSGSQNTGDLEDSPRNEDPNTTSTDPVQISEPKTNNLEINTELLESKEETKESCIDGSTESNKTTSNPLQESALMTAQDHNASDSSPTPTATPQPLPHNSDSTASLLSSSLKSSQPSDPIKDPIRREFSSKPIGFLNLNPSKTSSKSKPCPKKALQIWKRKLHQDYPKNTSVISEEEILVTWKGITNEKLYCYMNAILQCLMAIPEFVQYFTQEHKEWDEPEEKKDPISGEIKYADKFPFCRATRQMIFDYFDKDKEKIDITYFKELFEEDFDPEYQHDSSKFLSNMLGKLKSELNPTAIPFKNSGYTNKEEAVCKYKEENDSIIDQLFTGLYMTSYKCKKCKECTITYEPFGNVGLECNTRYPDRGFNNFMKSDQITQYSEFYCRKCDNVVKCTIRKRTVIHPKYYALVYQRTDPMTNKKICDLMKYKLNFELKDPNFRNKTLSYGILGIVSHDGDSLDSVRYVAFTKKNGNWKICNDENVDEGKNYWDSYKSDYILFYKRY
ncbi:unnamed protein product [Moneuplotes crassus]|uniref:USP domain-containing protein n=1 Tax=Euplotes crassus TaxID=5936 RepID=A0AAD1U1R3_EUPCR|nr:unnamed protein product [Moneuplotes crassus]